MNRDPLADIIIKSLTAMILSVSLLELADGFLTVKFGFSYISTITRLLFLFLPLFLIIYVPVDRGIAFLGYASALFLLMFLRLLRPETKFKTLIFEFQYTARSALLLVSIVLLGYVLQADGMKRLFRRFFPIQWVLITLAVFAHILLGVGGMTYTSGYQLRAGYTSYFVSSNQVVFLYAAAWWVFVSLTIRNLFVRIILTVLTLAVMLAMGTRSGVVLTVMMSCLYVYKKIFDKSRPAFAAVLLLSAGFGVVVLMNFSFSSDLSPAPSSSFPVRHPNWQVTSQLTALLQRW